jgi:transposase
MKEYYKSDLRKTTSILKELHHLQLIHKVPCYKSIDNWYNDKTLTPLLDRLILLTSLPLADIERTAAMDSTGFSVSKYDSWQEHKWGTPSERTRCWRKLHAVVGCTTNIFVSVSVTEKNVADITMLPSVVSDHPHHFAFQDFVADKAYSSRDVFKFLDKLGLEAYIPFKRGSSSDPKGSKLWKQMYQFFRKMPEEYNLHYHQRSNIETTFHMLKQRYGHRLLTKEFVANENEIKARVLCHNLTVLIQEAAERGVIADFAACVKTAHSVQKPN